MDQFVEIYNELKEVHSLELASNAIYWQGKEGWFSIPFNGVEEITTNEAAYLFRYQNTYITLYRTIKLFHITHL